LQGAVTALRARHPPRLKNTLSFQLVRLKRQQQNTRAEWPVTRMALLRGHGTQHGSTVIASTNVP
jgi:hypothetical protein